MKKTGIHHSILMKEISKLGHTDSFLIADTGMPIPNGVIIIDLAFNKGNIPFHTVLKAILEEVQVESACIAKEFSIASKEEYDSTMLLLSDVATTEVSHNDLKSISENCRFAIRTGEYTPYANVILKAGVVF